MYHCSKIRISDLNPHLMCVLCGGYFIEATTIIECLHSFCRTCIVCYLESSKFCPICDVQVHKTRPLLNIRSDKTLQDLVYKLVPGLFQEEMRRRREFLAQHPEIRTAGMDLEQRGLAHLDTGHCNPQHSISLALHLHRPGTTVYGTPKQAGSAQWPEKRYLLCPSAVNIGHLKKFLRLKLGLSPKHQIDVFYKDEDEVIHEDFTLLDVTFVYSWDRLKPLRLFYSVYEKPRRKRRQVCRSQVTQTKKARTPCTPASPARHAPPPGPPSHSHAGAAAKLNNKLLNGGPPSNKAKKPDVHSPKRVKKKTQESLKNKGNKLRDFSLGKVKLIKAKMASLTREKKQHEVKVKSKPKSEAKTPSCVRNGLSGSVPDVQTKNCMRDQASQVNGRLAGAGRGGQSELRGPVHKAPGRGGQSEPGGPGHKAPRRGSWSGSAALSDTKVTQLRQSASRPASPQGVGSKVNSNKSSPRPHSNGKWSGRPGSRGSSGKSSPHPTDSTPRSFCDAAAPSLLASLPLPEKISVDVTTSASETSSDVTSPGAEDRTVVEETGDFEGGCNSAFTHHPLPDLPSVSKQEAMRPCKVMVHHPLLPPHHPATATKKC